MTGAERARGAGTPGRPPPGVGATPRALRGASERWASPDAIRQAVGAWAYTLPPSERRPSTAEVRDAVAVACAVRECAGEPQLARWGAHRHAAVGDAVVRDVAMLAERAGLEAAVAADALALLEVTGVLTRHGGATDAVVALAEWALAPQPTVARVSWPAVRERVRAAQGSLGPALAALRELAAAAGPVPAGDSAPPVRLSVRALEERTGYGRSTIAESVGALERGRLVDVEARAGRTARFTLRPAAFGQPDLPVHDLAAAEGAAGLSVAPTKAPPAATASTRAVERQAASLTPVERPAAGATPVRLGDFAGTPIYGPPGTPLVVACDADGRWTCRVGPFLTLGPAE